MDNRHADYIISIQSALNALSEAVRTALEHVEDVNAPRKKNECTLCLSHRKILRDALEKADAAFCE